MTKTAYVYILASQKNGTLYTGVTNNLERRMYEHKAHLMQGFTDKYNVTRLVWFTHGKDMQAAIALIEKTNPHWKDLAADNFGASRSCDYA